MINNLFKIFVDLCELLQDNSNCWHDNNTTQTESKI